ncbi:DUF3305 domain-containing protein [Ideonella sp. YS5]|uniref:DUF3305 domain-containing protein n=1 Tax=Ideonella sp. YS5 TaxID=3453714 RepID=UPI003EE84AC5
MEDALDSPAVERRLTLRAAVLIEREQAPNEWEAWRFRLAGVEMDDGHLGSPTEDSRQPRVLRDDGRRALWAFPGFKVELHPDQAEGYYLNLTSGQPVWFVMWRVDDEDPSRAWPEIVTLSYHEAGRWLDAQERVDNCPLPTPVVELLQAYADEHYKPEPRKRQRPASFRAPEERGGREGPR